MRMFTWRLLPGKSERKKERVCYSRVDLFHYLCSHVICSLYILPLVLSPSYHRLDSDDNGRVSIKSSNATQAKRAAAITNQTNTQNPFRNQDPFASYNQHAQTSNADNFASAPSSPRSPGRSGHVTPPPNSRHKRTSTPPGAANTISRTNSRHSKSSSDGSFDTPAPSSPPYPGMAGIAGSMAAGIMTSMKPPHARSTPISKTARRKSGSRGGPGGDHHVGDAGNGVVSGDSSEAFYAKSWMCGFTDAFNFEGFDTNFQEK